jgi:hypothetical protein
MKTRYLLIFILLLGMIVVSCSKSSNETSTSTIAAKQTTPYTAGQTLTYSFIAGNDTMVKMRDVVMDYGFTDFPVLVLVHQETFIQQPGWGSVFFPLIKTRLDTFLILWAREFSMNYLTVKEKAFVARNFLDYIINNNLDVGLFVDMVLGYHGLKMSTVMQVISEAKNHGRDPNNCLLRMMKDNISPEEVLSELKSTQQGFAILSIYLGIIKTIETWVKFADNSGPVANAPQNYMSFLCSLDTVLSHYTGGTNFQSRDYILSYDAGLWEAKCTYHIEGVYNAVNTTCAGKYIPKCNTISTYVHVKGPDFIVDGNVGYSPAVNSSQNWDVPVAEEDGNVQVTYGDCCCFRKFSNLNFKVDAGTGYKESTWDPGK